jgi:hypothetical protein
MITIFDFFFGEKIGVTLKNDPILNQKSLFLTLNLGENIFKIKTLVHVTRSKSILKWFIFMVSLYQRAKLFWKAKWRFCIKIQLWFCAIFIREFATGNGSRISRFCQYFHGLTGFTSEDDFLLATKIGFSTIDGRILAQMRQLFSSIANCMKLKMALHENSPQGLEHELVELCWDPCITPFCSPVSKLGGRLIVGWGRGVWSIT